MIVQAQQRGAVEPEIFRISPELRRCCWYVIIAMWLLVVPTFFVVAYFLQQRSWLDVAAGSSVFVLIGLAMCVPLTWVIQLDEHGIRRRLGYWWDRWTWNDLSSRRIRKAHPFTLIDPVRPWWRRRIHLDYMKSEERRHLLEVINLHYRLPRLPRPRPDYLKLKTGFRQSVTFDAVGLHVLAANTSSEYSWIDVRQLVITRMDSLRRDFRRLEIVLPDRVIELKLVSHQGGTFPSWRGAEAEVVNEILLRHVPEERWEISIAGDVPKSCATAKRRLDAAIKERREFHIRIAMFLPPITGCLIWMAVVDGVLKAVLMTVASLLPTCPVIVWLICRNYKKISELERVVESLADRNKQLQSTGRR